MHSLELGLLPSLGRLVDKRLVNVRDDTTTSNGGLDESIEFLVTSNGKLKMPGCDTLDLQILAGISSQLQDFSSEIFENGGSVDSSRGSNTLAVLDRTFQETMNTTDRKLQTCLGRTRLRSFL